MPFMGQDWRSPGEEWVKTDEGWEKKKLLECLNRSVRERLELENNLNNNEDMLNNSDKCNDSQLWQPFCPITIKCTREIAGFNGLSEAFKRLDFRNAVRDIRRFNYICKLLHLLITRNLTMLSGCAQKVLFNMLEEVASQVSTNQTNIHILQQLLRDLQKTLFEYYCWGRPLGSTQLWENHRQRISRINSIASCIVIKQPSDLIYPKLQDLPEEVVREILLRLSDHTDLLNSGKAYQTMQQLLNEQHIWRELCRFHFTPQQIRHVLSTMRRKSINKRNNLATSAFHSDNTGSQQAPAYGLRFINIFAPMRQSGHHNNDNSGSSSDENDENIPENDNALFKENIDWQQLYHKLRRNYGLREEYAEILQLCRYCRCLFWKSLGHPCIGDENTEAELQDKSTLYVPITPQAFLKFFSL